MALPISILIYLERQGFGTRRGERGGGATSIPGSGENPVRKKSTISTCTRTYNLIATESPVGEREWTKIMLFMPIGLLYDINVIRYFENCHLLSS